MSYDGYLNLPDPPAESFSAVKVYDGGGNLVRVVTHEEIANRPDPLPRDPRSYDEFRRKRREARQAA